jgi:hypothetical protein
MPHKFNADHRNKIPKQKHRLTNWAEYNESRWRRCDLTVWISGIVKLTGVFLKVLSQSLATH